MSDKLLIKSLQRDIERNEVVLPTLPDVALTIRDIVEDESSTQHQVVSAIQTDPALSARILQIANSPNNRANGEEVVSLNVAVSKIGLAVIPHLVTGLVMGQLFHSPNPEVERLMRQTWVHSSNVANIAKGLAEAFTRLQPEVAYLSGLVHEIGTLPILRRAEWFISNGYLIEDLPDIVQKYHAEVGRVIADAWHFPSPIKDVINEHEHLNRNETSPIDYTDLVILADLQDPCYGDPDRKSTDYSDIPSFKKLGDASIDAINISSLPGGVS